MTPRGPKRFRARTILFLLSALALGLLPAVGWAQGSPSVPDHAYIDFGKHWRCERGFKAVNGGRGAYRTEERCEEVKVPEHAFLDYTGNDWRCERGYKRADRECRSLELPEHAYLDFNGNDWVCDRGFKREGNRCSPE